MTPSVVKVSAGAVEYVPIAQGILRQPLILKTQGCWVVGTEANTGVDCLRRT